MEKKNRKLNLSEISQIAGRAGRHINDGYFGTTGQCENISPEEVEILEQHKINKINTIYWRNSNLNMENIENLILSLEQSPNNSILKRIKDCEDEKVFKYLTKNDTGIKIINDHQHIKILWECCQIPDFAKKAYGQHIEIVKKVFTFLTSNKNKITNNYIKEQLKALDKYSGNIDTLANRISNVRTWAYVSNKKNWVENQDYWVEITKNMEDKLSECLHQELTKSFIDKRISILSRSLKQDISLGTEIKNDGDVIIDGQFIGKLKSLKLYLDFKSGSLDNDIKSLKKAARQAIAPELIKRISKICKSENLKLNNDHKIYWMDHPIAFISPGKDYLNPILNLVVDESLEIEPKEKLKAFLNEWLKNQINIELHDLVNLTKSKIDSGNVRALSYQLFENNGILKRSSVFALIKNLQKEDRIKLRNLGIKIGRYHIYLPRMLKPNAVSLRVNLWKNYFSNSEKIEPPKFGLNFFENNKEKNYKFLLICGFEKFEDFYVRVDILERLFLKIIESSYEKKFKLHSDMINLLGCTKKNFLKLLTIMEYKYEKNEKSMEEFFIYSPKKIKYKKMKKDSFIKKNNPFEILSNVNLK